MNLVVRPHRTVSEALQALDNREIATACWIALAVALCLFSASLRHALAGVIRAAAVPQILGVFTVASSAQLLATYGLWKLGVWTPSQAKITAIWVVIGFFSFVNKALKLRDQPTTLKAQLRSVFKLTLLVEFFVNLYRFSLFIELAFVPFMVLLGLLVATSERDPRHSAANRVFLSIAVFVGLLVAAYSLYQAYQAGWEQFTPNLARDFAVPILYGVLTIPLLWLLALFSAYQEVFIRVPLVVKDSNLHAYTKFNLLARLRFDLRAVGRWLKIAWQVMPTSRAEVLQSIQAAKAPAGAALYLPVDRHTK